MPIVRAAARCNGRRMSDDERRDPLVGGMDAGIEGLLLDAGGLWLEAPESLADWPGPLGAFAVAADSGVDRRTGRALRSRRRIDLFPLAAPWRPSPPGDELLDPFAQALEVLVVVIGT